LGILAAALLCLAGAAAAGEEYQGRVEKSFSAKPGGRLVLATERGDVRVSVWERDEVSVRMTMSSDGLSKKEAEDFIGRFGVDMRGENGDVLVDVTYRRDRILHMRRSSVTIEVQTPSRYNVDVSTAGGDVGAAGLTGSATLKTSGGDVTADAIAGDVDVVTSGGNITVSAATGGVHANTSGGNIRIVGCGGAVEARTSGGDIEIREARAQVLAITSGGNIMVGIVPAAVPECEARTSGGNVTVTLPEDASARLDASAFGGSVECGMPVTIKEKVSRSRLEGVMGEGGNTVKLWTSGGNVRIRRS
jgi:DUF4097 and DUF4098 domain-containing protein YvlB